MSEEKAIRFFKIMAGSATRGLGLACLNGTTCVPPPESEQNREEYIDEFTKRFMYSVSDRIIVVSLLIKNDRHLKYLLTKKNSPKEMEVRGVYSDINFMFYNGKMDSANVRLLSPSKEEFAIHFPQPKYHPVPSLMSNPRRKKRVTRFLQALKAATTSMGSFGQSLEEIEGGIETLANCLDRLYGPDPE